MRLSIFAAAIAASLALAAAAHADPKTPDPKTPDLTLVWDEGEISLDMSMWRTTITVTGTKVHYEATYSGRDGGMSWTKPRHADGVIKDPTKVAAALAAFDKTKEKVRPKDVAAYSGYEESGCLTRGKTDRCAIRRGNEPASDELAALTAVKAAVLEGVKTTSLLVP